MRKRKLNRWLSIPAVAITATVVLVTLSPVIGHGWDAALGDPAGEGACHLWGLWVTADELWTHGPFKRVADVNYPAGFDRELLDPINLLVFWPVWTIGGRGPVAAAMAWNLIHALTLVLAALGGWRLARRLVGPGVAPLVALAATLCAPYLLNGSLAGRSEYLAAAWYPLHLSFLVDHLKPGRRPRDTIGAALTLGLLANSGWVVAFWIAALEIPLALVLCRQLPGWRTRGIRLAQVAAPALLMTLPVLWVHLNTDPWWLHRSAPTPWNEPSFRALPLENLCLFIPDRLMNRGIEVAPYTSHALFLAALLGAIWRPRKALPWLALGGLLMILACGPTVSLSWGGEVRVFQNLVTTGLCLIPPVNNIGNWNRMGLVAAFPLALAAAHAADVVVRRWPRAGPNLALVLTGLIVIEGLLWRPLEPASFHTAIPPELSSSLSSLDAGAVLELPAGHPPAESSQEDFTRSLGVADLSLLWSMQHERPTTHCPQPSDRQLAQLSVLAYNEYLDVGLAQFPCADSEQARLASAGFTAVVLVLDRVPQRDATPVEWQITQLLGPPEHRGSRVVIWPLEAGGAVPDTCQIPLSSEDPRLTHYR